MARLIGLTGLLVLALGEDGVRFPSKTSCNSRNIWGNPRLGDVSIPRISVAIRSRSLASRSAATVEIPTLKAPSAENRIDFADFSDFWGTIVLCRLSKGRPVRQRGSGFTVGTDQKLSVNGASHKFFFGQLLVQQL